MARAAVAVRTGRPLHSCCGGAPSGVVDGKLAYDLYGDRWSRFTFLIYLNDDFDGGATTFYTPSERPPDAPPDAKLLCCILQRTTPCVRPMQARKSARCARVVLRHTQRHMDGQVPPPCTREGRGGPSPGAYAKGASADPVQMKPG
jgi:hypothetical protein